LADIFLTEEFTAICFTKTSLDLLKQVKPIEGIFDASVVRKLFNCFQHLLLRLHNNSPVPCGILAPAERESQLGFATRLSNGLARPAPGALQRLG